MSRSVSLHLSLLLFYILLPSHRAVPERVPVASAPDVMLRVALLRFFSQTATLSVGAPAGATLMGPKERVCAEGPGEWRFEAGEGRVTATDEAGRVLAAGATLRILVADAAGGPPLSIRHGARIYRYRGGLEITGVGMEGEATEKRLRIVNVLPLETYLRGVIAEEMSPSAPPEALKAQAIAARTHALKGRFRFQPYGYDLPDTTAAQVYGGVAAERDATDVAVRETEGLVLEREGQLIWADYYDDCGGVTSAGEQEGDYPPSVVDAPEGGGPDYCARGTYHTWTLTLNPEELLQRLGAARRQRLGSLQAIRITAKEESGRARRIMLEGDRGREEMTGSAFREIMGPSNLKSTLFTVMRAEGGAFVFAGRGYGHGHGLCQMGAIGQAASPYQRTYREILAHYFPGSAILPWKTLEAKRGGR